MTPAELSRRFYLRRFYLRSIKTLVDCWLLKISLDPRWLP